MKKDEHIKIDKTVEIDIEAMTNALKMMQTQSKSTITIEEFLKNFATLKVEEDKNKHHDSFGKENIDDNLKGQSNTYNDISNNNSSSLSPNFSFQSPTKVFTPFQVKTINKITMKTFNKNSISNFDFNSEVADGPFTTQKEVNKISKKIDFYEGSKVDNVDTVNVDSAVI